MRSRHWQPSFFLEWCFIRIPWLYNYNDSGAIEVPTRTLLGTPITGPSSTPSVRYYVILALIIFLAWIASNLIRGRIGRSWMMIRDMDIAAELMGIKPLNAKLSAFAVSSYFLRRCRRPDGVHVVGCCGS